HVVTRALVAGLTAAFTTFHILAAAQSPSGSNGRILVMPFENVSRDSRIFWLGEGASVVLADDLNDLGGDAITREERRHAFERLQVPPVAVLTDATVIRIGQLLGASQVIVGSLELEGDSLVVHARSIALEAGRVQSSVVERGPIADLFATFERVARRLAPASTVPSQEVERQHPPLPVFEDYVKGLLADSPATAIRYLSSALERQPTFDRARLALWDVYEEEGDHARALESVKAVSAGSPLARRAQFLA